MTENPDSVFLKQTPNAEFSEDPLLDLPPVDIATLKLIIDHFADDGSPCSDPELLRAEMFKSNRTRIHEDMEEGTPQQKWEVFIPLF